MSDPLQAFSPPVRTWFRETFGEPTSPQAQGWPPIQRGEHTLILAPTGSGKTLAAFLWGIDELYRDAAATSASNRKNAKEPGGVRLLYVSPLKALNNDIERNLRVPLEGIRAVEARSDRHWPPLRVAVRTGDTPSNVRAQMLKHPPDILITTPESLCLMLSSPRARVMFKTVRSVIVDEIHTLSGNKRGVHLALSLERLAHLAGQPVQRIGLSATIKPLEEVARFLGGQVIRPDGVSPRPVTIVNAYYRKALDLEVVTAVDDFREVPGSIWPAVIPQVLNDIRRHNTTLIFANNRRLAERTADRLNAQLAAEQSEEIAPGSMEALAPGGVPRDRGIFAIGAEGPIRAHHGSMSKEARRKMEEDLKAGRLPALVGTSSLELGIDIGAVDLVIQLQSPKSVAQGLQRVGRSGHLVGETSRGRIYATFREDLAESAAIARGMLEGDVELTFTPQNPLDVLAQQIVAMVAVEDWDVDELYGLVRRAYPYRDLALASFLSVIEMLAGKYHLDMPHIRAATSLRAKIAWDRANNRLTALPGSRMLAVSNPGTIPDTGAYGVYLNDGKTKVGELDEEFIFETRVGDVFLLGSNVWRVTEIADDHIVVADAGGSTPRMPFWNGDYPYRPFELGERIGRFRRQIVDKLRESPDAPDHPQVSGWLQREYALDERSARNLVAHVSNQIDAVGVMSSDQTIVVETFENAVGDPHMVIHSPFGGRVNGAWALALNSLLRERTGVTPETQVNDDGIIFRLPQSDREPPVEIASELTPEKARLRILDELPDSAVFGAQFRMNAARALLLPKARGRKRTPFWLQRLKAKDLLALVKRFDDFPIVAETYRDCLRDVFDLPHLEQVLTGIQNGSIQIVPIETLVPSPVASALLFNFVSIYMYEWDAPKAERQLQALTFKREALEDLLTGVELSDLLKPEAIAEVVERAQHLAPGSRARTAEELALVLRELGALSEDEIVARSGDDGRQWIRQLVDQGRVQEVNIPTAHGPEVRWSLVELLHEYYDVLGPNGEQVLTRSLRTSGPVTRDQILDRYAFGEHRLDERLSQLITVHELVRGHFTARDRDEYCDPHLLEQIHRRTLTLLRQEIKPVAIPAFADFLVRWQHMSSGTRLRGVDGLRRVMQQLRGIELPAAAWERDILPARLPDYDPADLDALRETGELVWIVSGHDAKRANLKILSRGEGNLFLLPPTQTELTPEAKQVYDYLKSEGASFSTDLEVGLGFKSAKVGNVLVELVLAGLVTNDSTDALRAIISGNAPAAAAVREPLSSLEADLAERLHGHRRAISATRYREAKRRIARRVNAETSPLTWSGRWSIVHRRAVMGAPRSDEDRTLLLVRALLERYGVLTREVLARQEGEVDWALIYPQLQRMELRGEIRRGYFIAGLSGIQFALPEALEELRRSSESEELVVLNATDPANPFGGEVQGITVRFARVPSTYLVMKRGEPLLLAEEHGERITAISAGEPEITVGALQAFLGRRHAPRHVIVHEWNGEPVSETEGRTLLERLGFYRTPGGMEWWAKG